jgi:cytochrome c-type biogenesis protein CcmH
MIGFWVSAALLAGLCIGRVLRRLSAEQPGKTLPHQGLVWLILLLAPSLALALYLLEGSPALPGQSWYLRDRRAALETEAARTRTSELMQRAASGQDIDFDDLSELALGLEQSGDYTRAAEIWGRAAALLPEDPTPLSAQGAALAYANGGIVTERAKTLFNQALDLDERDIRARFFLGLSRQQEGDDRAALAFFLPLLADTPPDAPWREELTARIRDSQKRLPLPGAD